MTWVERATAPLTSLSAGVFATLSALRGKRVFHPVGRGLEGVMVFNEEAAGVVPAPLLAKENRAKIRISRGAGIPEPLPDVLGMALKIPDAYGSGMDQDWLLVSAGRDPVRRHLLIPAVDFIRPVYSTVLPYRVGGRLATFGSFSVPREGSARTFAELEQLLANGPLEFAFAIAYEGEAHQILGRVKIATALSEEEDSDLRFNPWNTAPELVPAGGLNRLRRDSYQASQQARPDA